MDEGLLKLFSEISSIPRKSGNEKDISDYLLNFAQKLGLDCTRDKFFNVIMEKKAANGKEHCPAIFIQAHMDMVCVKNKGSQHDFLQDGIEIIRNGDFLQANGTSLGADNGIGMAMILHLMEEDFNNPKIIGVFTADEERGLNGVRNLNLAPHAGVGVLINLDGEEEGVIVTSCAGGVRCKIEFPISRQQYHKDSNTSQLSITVKGLNGGHSGLKIDCEHANAILLLARILRYIAQKVQLKLLNIDGGSKENSIPTNASAIIAVNNKQASTVNELIAFLTCEIQGEYYISEEQLKLDVMDNTQEFDSAINADCFSRLTDMLALIPNGLLKRNLLRNCALASSNLGVISTEEDKIVISIMARSNIDSIKYQICDQMTILSGLFGTSISFQNDYPAWEYKNLSKIKEIIFEEYRKEFNSEPLEQSIHGGLECAYFAQKIPELDMVSIGPNIYDVHSVKERMSISSAVRTYRLLRNVAENYE